MRRVQVKNTLLEAFRGEFASQMAAIRRDWEDYQPDARTDQEGLSTLRRELHTMKGSVRLLGLTELAETVHALEEQVAAALAEQRKPEEFLEALWDFEEAVGGALGYAQVDEMGTESVEMNAVSGRTRESSGAAYGLLLALDELLGMGEEFAESFDHGQPPSVEQMELALAQFLERLRTIREGARKMALVPSHELFSGLPELARRAATDSGKQVRVTVRARPDQVERETVLALRPAMVHLVANAVSHGLKKESGTLELAYQRGESHLEVSVADQGPGLDLEKLERAVVGGGYLDQSGWNALSLQERQQWIFSPGLSTRGKADLTAGRGMGLSVVAETVQRLNGTVVVESGPEGTTFRLTVPVGWEMCSVLRVTSAGQDLVVLSSELVAVGNHRTEDRVEAVRLGELAAVLGYPQNQAPGPYLLLFKQAERTVAVSVEELGDFDDMLVRPLSGFSGLDPAIVGVTPMRGRPLLVISLSGLRGQTQKTPRIQVESSHGTEQPLLLVVDDSVTTRTLVSGILTAHGYRVALARDGVEGLEVAQSEQVALVVCDYQMPRLDGLQFLEKFRADAKTADVPFILLTSIDDMATFEKASALGADRCLGKQNFTQERLLGLVGELL